MQTLKVFIGYDRRQPVALQVLAHSIYRHSSQPVSITPLVLSQLPIKRRGLTEFTYSRYLVPWLCNFVGRAAFLDADMLVKGDIAELFAKADLTSPVSVVKEQQLFEWPSLMIYNCSHADVRKLTPAYIDNIENRPNTFGWASNIGDLPKEWNQCVGYDQPNHDAKLLHFTAGIPCFEETKGCEGWKDWNDEAFQSMGTVDWKEIMGGSVHEQNMRSTK